MIIVRNAEVEVTLGPINIGSVLEILCSVVSSLSTLLSYLCLFYEIKVYEDIRGVFYIIASLSIVQGVSIGSDGFRK